MARADVKLVTRPGASWLLTAVPGAPELWLRATVVDADRANVLLAAGDGSRPPAPGTKLVGAHGAGDGIRRFQVTVRRHVAGAVDRFVVTAPDGFEHVERRQDERVPVRLDAELVFGVGGGEMETIRATTIDVSASGVAVLSPQPLRVGRRLLVLVHIGDDKPILGGAVVAGQQLTPKGNSRVGLDLQLVEPDDRERLRAYLARVAN